MKAIYYGLITLIITILIGFTFILFQRETVIKFDPPTIVEIDDFLSTDEIQELLDLGSKNLKPSQMISSDKDYTDTTTRRSNSAFFNEDYNNHKLIKTIKKRAAVYTKLPEGNAEDLQLLQYEKNGMFLPHHDYFKNPGNLTYENNMKRGGQRVYTFFIYLNDDFEGGETEFPLIKKKFKPKKGKALFWKNLDDRGNPNPLTKHGGNVVTSGMKYACNLWIKEKTFH